MQCEHARLPAWAMKVPAPTTLLTLHGDSLSAFRRIAECVELVPPYRLELETEIDQIPATIDELLEHLRR